MREDCSECSSRTSTKSTCSGEAKPVNQVRESVNDAHPKYQSVALNEGARIRIVNCSNDSNKHSSVPPRPSSNANGSKKLTNSLDKLDENWSTKSTRINTRKISSTHSKGTDLFEVCPTYQAQSVLLSKEDIAQAWLTHNVFYRCHACAHEEFFVVLSRECMRLHVSSKHGNMEENFKQRLSNFLNNQGRALKIFQHYLKWQQPWSEEEIDQIFQLANVINSTNGRPKSEAFFLSILSSIFRCTIEWQNCSKIEIVYLLVQSRFLSYSSIRIYIHICLIHLLIQKKNKIFIPSTKDVCFLEIHRID